MGVETEMDGVKELHTLRVWMIEYLANGIKPCLKLVVFLHGAILIAPVSCQPLFCYFIHPLATDLHLNPLGIGA